jgi:hypothetical protein
MPLQLPPLPEDATLKETKPIQSGSYLAMGKIGCNILAYVNGILKHEKIERNEKDYIVERQYEQLAQLVYSSRKLYHLDIDKTPKKIIMKVLNDLFIKLSLFIHTSEGNKSSYSTPENRNARISSLISQIDIKTKEIKFFSIYSNDEDLATVNFEHQVREEIKKMKNFIIDNPKTEYELEIKKYEDDDETILNHLSYRSLGVFLFVKRKEKFIEVHVMTSNDFINCSYHNNLTKEFSSLFKSVADMIDVKKPQNGDISIESARNLLNEVTKFKALLHNYPFISWLRDDNDTNCHRIFRRMTTLVDSNNALLNEQGNIKKDLEELTQTQMQETLLYTKAIMKVKDVMNTTSNLLTSGIDVLADSDTNNNIAYSTKDSAYAYINRSSRFLFSIEASTHLKELTSLQDIVIVKLDEFTQKVKKLTFEETQIKSAIIDDTVKTKNIQVLKEHCKKISDLRELCYTLIKKDDDFVNELELEMKKKGKLPKEIQEIITSIIELNKDDELSEVVEKVVSNEKQYETFIRTKKNGTLDLIKEKQELNTDLSLKVNLNNDLSREVEDLNDKLSKLKDELEKAKFEMMMKNQSASDHHQKEIEFKNKLLNISTILTRRDGNATNKIHNETQLLTELRKILPKDTVY